MFQISVNELNNQAVQTILGLIEPLCNSVDGENSLLEKKYQNDVTIAVGQEPVKLSKKRQAEAATRMFNFAELD